MTASRAKAAFLTVALVLAAWGADAQTQPDSTPASTDNAADTPVEAQPGVPVERPQSDVQVNSLGSLDGPAVGLLDASSGGFDGNIWLGSSRADIETLLSRIPIVSPDPAVRALATRLILTEADVPVGPAHRALITIRIEKLLDAGLIDEAGALAAKAQLKDDLDFARVQADALLIAGRDGDVCGDLTATRLTNGELFWLQLRAYCAAAGGDAAMAELTRNIIDAEGQTDDAYNVLVDNVLTGAKAPPGPIAKPTAMHVFLLRKLNWAIGGDVASVLGTSENLLALRDARNPPDVRLGAAERILRTGAAKADELRAVTDAQTVPDTAIATALQDAPSMPFVAGQTVLRRAAQLEPRPGVKIKYIDEALSLAAKENLLEVGVVLHADIAAPATGNNVDPLIARALMLNGKWAEAAHWRGNDDRPEVEVLRDLAAPNPVSAGPAQAALSQIAAAVTAQPQAASSQQSYDALLLGLYDAMARPMPEDAKAAAGAAGSQQWPGRRPPPESMQNLMQAATQPDRKGEAILRILDIVGAGGPGDLAPDITIELVRTLEQLGLPDAAEAFATEAALLFSPPPPPPPPQSTQ